MEKMGMGFKFQIGMELGTRMKSLKWAGFGTKNLFRTSLVGTRIKRHVNVLRCRLFVIPVCWFRIIRVGLGFGWGIRFGVVPLIYQVTLPFSA